MNETIYQLSGLTHRYGDALALSLESLSIPRGGIVGVAGPNGSGKSTLLSILAFLSAPTKGTVLFEGQNVNFNNPVQRLDVTLLLQEPYLLKRSVFSNVAYGLEIRGQRSNIKDRVFEALTWVGLDPDRFAHRRWHQLSGGEAQRVALASRLILRPKVLLLDEPLASVDAASAALIQKASLMAQREWGATLVIVSHDLLWLYEVSDEVLSLFRGRLVGSGPENVILGPWSPGDSGLLVRKLEDGQRIQALEVSLTDQVLVIDPSQVEIALDRPAEQTLNEPRNCIHGLVSSMIYEKPKDAVLIKVAAGDIFITARLTRQAASTLSLHPGQSVWVNF